MTVDVRVGSDSDIAARVRNVRSTLRNEHRLVTLAGPKSANEATPTSCFVH